MKMPSYGCGPNVKKGKYFLFHNLSQYDSGLIVLFCSSVMLIIYFFGRNRIDFASDRLSWEITAHCVWSIAEVTRQETTGSDLDWHTSPVES
jgi:hypothetical protein